MIANPTAPKTYMLINRAESTYYDIDVSVKPGETAFVPQHKCVTVSAVAGGPPSQQYGTCQIIYCGKQVVFHTNVRGLDRVHYTFLMEKSLKLECGFKMNSGTSFTTVVILSEAEGEVYD